MKKRVAVLFGGQSSEYRISCLSAAFVIDTLRRIAAYEVLPIGITPQGEWYLFDGDTEALRQGSWNDEASRRRLLPTADRSFGGFPTTDGEVVPVDVVFPVLHGKFGEDGTVQGLLALAGLPVVGCGTLASALAMDKIAANTLYLAAGLDHARYLALRDYEWRAAPADWKRKIAAELGFPCFVKPANAGSSIGISKVRNAEELEAAVQLAFQHDRRILVEEAIAGREIELSVLGADDRITVSSPGEIRPARDFYDYVAKYDDETSELIIPALLDPEIEARLKDAARRAFIAVDGRGLCRADFFLVGDRVLINELNTMPGFTDISMFPRLLAHDGITPEEQLKRLVELAE